MKQEESKPQKIGDVTIKTEPGTSTTPATQRLPSLRPPRDLSLSAYSQKSNLNQNKNKKIFVPNFNVQRIKQNTSGTVTNIKVEPPKPNLPDKTERGRGRAKKNFVQLNEGVFSEGVYGLRNVGRGRSSSGGGGGDGETLKKPTFKLKEDVKIDKEKEENTMKQLLSDDFIDDPTLEPDFEHCPITLPLLNAKEDPGLKRKCDIKPVDIKENITVHDVFSDAKVSDPGFIFFQLPSSMPGLKSDETMIGEPQSSSSTENPKPKEEECVLSSLPGGKIGKLQMLKSGRARLVFGNTKMWLEMGTQVAFKQDLVSVNLDPETHSGHMINLGSVSVKMMATPDWEAMIAGAPPV